MSKPEKNGAERFVELYCFLYQKIVGDYLRDKGEELQRYKKFEPDLLGKFYMNYKDEAGAIDQISSLVSKLIILQSLPNANHRSAFLFIRYYLKKYGIYIEIYEDEKTKYDKFYDTSKFLIDRDINHHFLYADNYMDVHHDMAINSHLASTKNLLEEIVKWPQSGMVELESFHSFVASTNQTGSLPFSNHFGSSN